MAGAYCQFCDHRCFVERTLPDLSWQGHMATCPKGMAHDRKVTGHDYRTAVNPRDRRYCEKCRRNLTVYPGLTAQSNETKFDRMRFCAPCIDHCYEHYDPHHQCVICA